MPDSPIGDTDSGRPYRPIRSRPLAVGCVLLAVLCSFPVAALVVFASFYGDPLPDAPPPSWAWELLKLAVGFFGPTGAAVAITAAAVEKPLRPMVVTLGVLVVLAVAILALVWPEARFGP